MARHFKAAPAVAATALALSVAACGHNPMSTYSWGSRHHANLSERDCMARAMYFESNRSSEEGMKAVGTVVMNRVASGQYSGNICNVVGAPRQFAPGVLSKPVSGSSWALAQRSADAVLAGERHARVGRAMHFHTAGYTFPYRNMAYVVAAGGNVFYEKRTPGSFTPVHPNVFVAEAAQRRPERSMAPIVLARAEAPAPRAEPVARLEQEAPRVLASAAAPRAFRQDAEEPRRRSEPARLAGLDDRAARGRRDEGSARATDRSTSRIGQARHQLAMRNQDEAPRQRTKPERIRLAHLDDSDMPKSLRQRSDAAPGGIPLAYRGQERPEAPKAGARKADPVRPVVARAAMASLGPAKSQPPVSAPRSEARKPDLPKLSAKPVSQPLPYREAKAKPAQATPAQLGWKKGPDAAIVDKTRKRF